MPTEQDVPGFQQVVSARLRHLRNDRGWSQDAAATRLQRLGVAWTRATVNDIEGGRRVVSPEELILLLRLFGEGHQPFGLAAFLGQSAPIPVGVLSLSPQTMGDMMAGRHAEVGAEDTLRVAVDESVSIERSAQSEAEKAAARTLKTTPKRISALSHHLWGHGLTEERDSRVDALGPEAATRGHRAAVTRELIQELRAEIKQRRKR